MKGLLIEIYELPIIPFLLTRGAIGNTTDFGSVIHGSRPCGSTKLFFELMIDIAKSIQEKILGYFFLLKQSIIFVSRNQYLNAMENNFLLGLENVEGEKITSENVEEIQKSSFNPNEEQDNRFCDIDFLKNNNPGSLNIPEKFLFKTDINDNQFFEGLQLFKELSLDEFFDIDEDLMLYAKWFNVKPARFFLKNYISEKYTLNHINFFDEYIEERLNKKLEKVRVLSHAISRLKQIELSFKNLKKKTKPVEDFQYIKIGDEIYSVNTNILLRSRFMFNSIHNEEERKEKLKEYLVKNSTNISEEIDKI